MVLFSLEDIWAILTIDQSYVQAPPNVVLHTAQQPVEKINNFRVWFDKSGFLVCEVETLGFYFTSVKPKKRDHL